MVLPHFDYVTPKSKEQASEMLLKYGDKAKVMAGATDLIIPMKDGAVMPVPEVIIDLKKLDGMRELEYDDETGLTIGALTTLREIEFSDLVWEKNPAVATAAKGWTDLSDMITVIEENGDPVDAYLTSQYLQDNVISRRFASYYVLWKERQRDSFIDNEKYTGYITECETCKYFGEDGLCSKE